MSEPAVKRPIVDLDEFERRLRRSAAPQSQDDPLAELARLVGGHEDPFKAVFEKDSPEQPLASRQPAARAAVQDTYAAEEPLRGTLSHDAYDVAPEAHAGHRLDQVPPVSYEQAPQVSYGQQAQPAAYDEEEPWLNVEPPLARPHVPIPDVQRSRRPLYIMAGIVVLGVAGIGASFAYKSSKSGPHQITTILAQSGPTKIQPEQPGGTDVPNQDASILDKSSQPIPVATVSHEEQPVDLAQQPMKSSDSVVSGAAGVPVPPPPGGQRSASTQGAAGWQSYGMDALMEPKKVKTVSVRPDNTLLPNDKPPQLPSSLAAGTPTTQRAAPQSSETTPKPVPTKATARVIPMKPAVTPPQSIEQLAANDTPAATETVPPKPKASPKPPKVAAEKPTAPEKVASAETGDDAAAGVTPASSGYAVQFAAPASEPEAHELTAKLTQKFGGQLSGHRLTYHRAKSGDKTVFRVRSSGLTKEEATSICQKVQTSGGSCYVAKD